MNNCLRVGFLALLTISVLGCAGHQNSGGYLYTTAPQPLDTPAIDSVASTLLIPRWHADIDTQYKPIIHQLLAPVITNNTVTTITPDGNVTTFDLASGAVRNRITLDISATVAAMTATNDTIFVADNNGITRAFERANGQSVWTYNTVSPITAPLVVDDNTIYLRSSDGVVHAVDSASGALRWRFAHSVPSLSFFGDAPVILQQNTAFIATDNGLLTLLRRSDGVPQQQIRITFPASGGVFDRLNDATITTTDDGVIMSNYQGNTAYVEQNGTIRWQIPFSSLLGGAADTTHAYLIADDGIIHAFATDNGRALWRNNSTQYRATTPPLLHKQWVIIGDQEGALHLLDSGSGKTAAVYKGNNSAIFAINANGDTLVVIHLDGTLNAFSLPS